VTHDHPHCSVVETDRKIFLKIKLFAFFELVQNAKFPFMYTRSNNVINEYLEKNIFNLKYLYIKAYRAIAKQF